MYKCGGGFFGGTAGKRDTRDRSLKASRWISNCKASAPWSPAAAAASARRWRAPSRWRAPTWRCSRATRERLAATAAELGDETAAGWSRSSPTPATTPRSSAPSPKPPPLLGGGIDILVNAAAEPGGYAAPPKLAEIQAAHLQREIDIKVMGYICAARARWRRTCRRSGWGRIVNISGLAARQSGNTVGSIRNVAVAALTKNLADELGPRGINVTVVHPGLTRTERTAALVAGARQGQGVSEEAIEKRMAEGNSIRHLVDAAEVADVVAFLARRNRWRSTATRSPPAAACRAAIHY